MQTTIFQNIEVAPAKNQLASVLKKLLENESVSERQTNYNGFRSRISDLRLKHNLDVRHTEVEFITEFGKKSSYRKHYLLEIDKDKAVQLYKEINK